jgi:2-oxoacid:acceptor oxidoreductase gamma subunit (pyruvate/2-ketoisovalerate family)
LDFLRCHHLINHKKQAGIMRDDIIEIRWHGRGGQGAITAAKIVANAAFTSGYGGVVMAPTFGTERRGAPVLTSLKISKSKIYDLSPITEPDMVLVLDHLLVEEVDVAAGLKPGGLIIINSPRPPETFDFPGMKIATADVTTMAANAGIIGAFAKAAGLLDMDTLAGTIEAEFAGKNPEKNAEAARMTHAHTLIGDA